MTGEDSTNKKRNGDAPKHIFRDRDSAYINISIMILFAFHTLVVAMIMTLS